MKPTELLGVFVRLAGLALILVSLDDLYWFVMKILGLNSPSQYSPLQDLKGFLIYFITGALIVAGANLIVRLAYWRDR